MLTQDDTLDRYSQSWFEQEYLPSYGIDPQNPSLTHLAARYNEELGPANLFRLKNRLLDVGAGAGLFLASARAAGWDVEGVEIAGYGPVYAQKHFDLHIVHGTLHEAQFPDDHFDVVMLQDTIEHVSDPLGLLTEVCRVLRPGGGVILSTPNVDSLVRRVFGSRWAFISPREHVHLFNTRSLLWLLKATGFAPFRLETSETVHPNAIRGTQTTVIRTLQKLLEQTTSPQIRPLLYKLSLGDAIMAIGVKQLATSR
jgi:2-polyprenyl-3-methyl-5-hydroxy-6-metoxy-1,4-benzoquinol methylase